ncbi:putative disease resistance protein RGA1 isoform X1 [Silene latifolia]|uniref:putative disease resistance protein RGA1 isoform X1 n=1 Tax=Silene latifolia TaxID=37657 RepID=UPI003D76E1CC
MSILKISYNNLEPSVKNCFRYCSLFPKDFEMDKQKLISLWMAQGYIDDSEDSFLVLLKRCFFQDVKTDDRGNVISFKMHDLLHDLSQEVAGDEIITASCPLNNLSKKSRHLFLDGEGWTKGSFHERSIRTCYMETCIDSSLVKTLVANWHNLRSLCIYYPHSKELPESIGELLHLRYLDLSNSWELKTLPNSIVKLYNLQSLILHSCRRLKEWPKYFSKLVNLRLLDIRGCGELIGVPLCIGQLINLRHLIDYNVDGGQLKDLKFLVNLRGPLCIVINRNHLSEKENVLEDSYLEHMKNLKKVTIRFLNEARENSYEATTVANLQPNRNLMQLSLEGYNGTEIPRWGRAHDDWAFILPNLVNIHLYSCKRLQGIPLLRNLKHLKSLFLFNLNNLEYMEPSAISHGSSGSKVSPFFPSLERLFLTDLKRLKGWWGKVGEGDSSSDMLLHWQPPFPRLSTLIINYCPKLASLPPCPTLKELDVRFNPGKGPVNLDLKLRVDEIDVAFKNSSSLLRLVIDRWVTLKSVSGVLEHLTALKSLSLKNLPAQVDYAEMPWRSLHNLCSLELASLESLKILPTWLRHLTALQNLSISCCTSLKGLPECISCLRSLHSLTIHSCPKINSLGTIQYITSLQKLEIVRCPNLIEACREPSGKEWPKIRHIPHNSISYTASRRGSNY